jgi:hypothetical protein
MKPAIALLLLCSTTLAGDCRYVAPVRVKAVRQNYYSHGYVKSAIIAYEEDPYHVELLAPELRAKQRAKEQAEDIRATREETRALTEEVKLLRQAIFLTKGQDPGVLQQQADPDEPFWKVLDANCAKCHTGDGSKGNQKFYESSGARVKLTPLQRFAIETATSEDADDKAMPPSAPLPDADRAVLRKSYKAHLPEIRQALKSIQAVPVAPPPGELK